MWNEKVSDCRLRFKVMFVIIQKKVESFIFILTILDEKCRC